MDSLLLSGTAPVNSRCGDMSSTARTQDAALTSSVGSSGPEVVKFQLRRAQEKAERLQKQVGGTSGCGTQQEG